MYFKAAGVFTVVANVPMGARWVSYAMLIIIGWWWVNGCATRGFMTSKVDDVVRTARSCAFRSKRRTPPQRRDNRPPRGTIQIGNVKLEFGNELVPEKRVASVCLNTNRKRCL